MYLCSDSQQTRGCIPATSTIITAVSTREEYFRSQWSLRWLSQQCRLNHCPAKTRVTHKNTNTQSLSSCSCQHEYLSRENVLWPGGFELSCVRLGEGETYTSALSFTHPVLFCPHSLTHTLQKKYRSSRGRKKERVWVKRPSSFLHCQLLWCQAF